MGKGGEMSWSPAWLTMAASQPTMYMHLNQAPRNDSSISGKIPFKLLRPYAKYFTISQFSKDKFLHGESFN